VTRLTTEEFSKLGERNEMMKAPANLTAKLAAFTERFSPRTVGTYNNNDLMVAKLEGSFHWHKHDDTDDFFFVLEGTLDIELRDRTVTLNPGDLFVVPKGVERRPVARGEVHILLIEPTGTPNTGDEATAAPRILA
jgi:mannose-6-phosphate isomerase-like protein (cupin superfamily)